MALFDDALKSWGVPALLGVGVVIAIPVVLPLVGAALRPVAKAAIKGYLAFSDAASEYVAGVAEELSDLVAEVKAERAGVVAAPSAASGAGASAE
jgi:hypothetical protein